MFPEAIALLSHSGQDAVGKKPGKGELANGKEAGLLGNVLETYAWLTSRSRHVDS